MDAATHRNDCTPLRKTCAHLGIFREPVTQSVQPLGYFLVVVTCQGLRTDVGFNPGNNSRFGDGFDKGSAIFLLLPDRLVVKDCATYGLTESRRGHNQLSIGAPSLLGLRNTPLGESLVTGRSTFIHCQQSFIACNHRLRRVYKRLLIHLVLLHFQFLISGISSPCLSM